MESPHVMMGRRCGPVLALVLMESLLGNAEASPPACLQIHCCWGCLWCMFGPKCHLQGGAAEQDLAASDPVLSSLLLPPLKDPTNTAGILLQVPRHPSLPLGIPGLVVLQG